MSGDAFAQEWPGRGAWGRKQGGAGRCEGPASWLFSRARHHGPGPERFDHLEDLIAWRRMRGGPFGMGGPGGPGPRGRRGRARRGDVRLALLRLLAEEPRNGYQLMQTIETRSGGRWSPSPGSVYPTLAQLEDEGLIRSTEADGSRRYEITDAGREHLHTREREPDPWEPPDAEAAGEGAIMELGPLVIQIGKAAWQVASVGDPAQRARAVQLLSDTRRALYGILAEEPDEAAEPEDGAGESDV